MRKFAPRGIQTALVSLLLASNVSCRPQFVASTSIAAERYTRQALTLRGGAGWTSSPLGARSASTVASPQQQSAQQQSNDRAVTKDVMSSFLTRDSRQSFIARVYAILSVQLLVTAISVLIFGLNPGITEWMRTPGLGASVPVISLLISTVSWFVMYAKPDARRKAPLKWKMLALFTAGEALSVGFMSSFYEFRSVMSAMMATAVAATSVSVYTAKQRNPKYDLSQWGAGISSAGLIFLVYGFVQLLQTFGVIPAGFLPYNDMLYGLAGACLFSFYLAYHTKLIVAGKHAKYQLSDQDYVFGAMTLYNDIINIFIYTLRLIGEDKKHS